MRSRYLLLSLLPLVAACDSNSNFTTPEPTAPPEPSTVFVANQGGFGANTSSITSFGLGSTEASQLFTGALGSTVQSASVVGDRLYVMSDEAGRIDVVDVDARDRVAQITDDDLTTARYFAAASATKAYVTQLYLPDGSFSGGRVAVLDLQANAVTGVIEDERFANPEGVAVVGSRAFVSNPAFGSGTTLSVIDTATDAVTGTIEIGCAARAVLPDAADGELYAFCGEEVVVVAASTEDVARRFPVPAALRPLGTSGLGQDAALAVEGATFDMVAVGTGGVLLLDAETDAMSAVAVAGERSISAVGLSGEDGGVLVLGRPDVGNPFSVPGVVTTHRTDGTLIATLPAGIYPTSVAFAGADAR